MSAITLADLSPEYQKQALDKLRRQQAAKLDTIGQKLRAAPKYHNEPAARGSIKFDSKKEADRFDELVLLERSGDIRNLRLQTDFTLMEAYTEPNGERVRALRYRADFTYERRAPPDIDVPEHWERVVEDVKSKATKTRAYLIKKKAMQNIYGITIQEV